MKQTNESSVLGTRLTCSGTGKKRSNQHKTSSVMCPQEKRRSATRDCHACTHTLITAIEPAYCILLLRLIFPVILIPMSLLFRSFWTACCFCHNNLQKFYMQIHFHWNSTKYVKLFAIKIITPILLTWDFSC